MRFSCHRFLQSAGSCGGNFVTQKNNRTNVGDSDIEFLFTDGDFVDKLWLLAVTLLLIMISGENLVERGRLEKTRKPKSGEVKPTEFWSPNFLGRLYRSATSGESEPGALTQRPHWRRGYIKSQPHGPRQSLRKIIWVSPYRAGRG
jgi:hypothetical protein